MNIDIKKAQQFVKAAERLEQAKSNLNTSYSLKTGLAKDHLNVDNYSTEMIRFIWDRKGHLDEAKKAYDAYRKLVNEGAHLEHENRLRVLYGIPMISRITGIDSSTLKQNTWVTDRLIAGDLTPEQIANNLEEEAA